LHGLVHAISNRLMMLVEGPELTVKVIDFGDLGRETRRRNLRRISQAKIVRVRRGVHSDYRFGDAQKQIRNSWLVSPITPPKAEHF
jgi:hypothetical protein